MMLGVMEMNDWKRFVKNFVVRVMKATDEDEAEKGFEE